MHVFSYPARTLYINVEWSDPVRDVLIHELIAHHNE